MINGTKKWVRLIHPIFIWFICVVYSFLYFILRNLWNNWVNSQIFMKFWNWNWSHCYILLSLFNRNIMHIYLLAQTISMEMYSYRLFTFFSSVAAGSLLFCLFILLIRKHCARFSLITDSFEFGKNLSKRFQQHKKPSNCALIFEKEIKYVWKTLPRANRSHNTWPIVVIH